MRRIKQYTILMLSALVPLATGCAADDAIADSEPSLEVPLAFTISPKSFTRFSETDADMLTEGFYIRIENSDTIMYQGNINDLDYEVNEDGGAIVWKTKKNWPSGAVKIMAISEMEMPEASTALLLTPDHDIVVANTETTLKKVGASGIVSLSFDHLFAGALISLKLDEGVQTAGYSALIREITLTPDKGNVYDFVTQEWSGSINPIFLNSTDPATTQSSIQLVGGNVIALAPDYDSYSDSPFLFLPGEYEVSVSYSLVDIDGAGPSGLIKTAKFSLLAGKKQNLTLLLTLP